MKQQNNRFGVAVTLASNTAGRREDFISRPVTTETDDVCPDCRIRLVRLGACFSCPTCGYGNCG